MSTSTAAVPQLSRGTPPEKETVLPLTPPPTSDWRSTSNPKSPVSLSLGLFRERQIPDGSSIELKLQPSEYKELWARLEEEPKLKGYVESKLRLDYDPFEGILVRRMPTTIHEVLQGKVSNCIESQLKRIAEGQGQAADFAAKIHNALSATIYLREFDENATLDKPPIRRDPDGQFQHADAEYPGLVLEIGYSQKGIDLDKAAWQYILYSNGDIKAVLGIDLGYGISKEAKISLWQPRYIIEEGVEILEVETVVDHKPFRASDGSVANAQETLSLPLNCFATSEIATLDSGPVPNIIITYKELARFLGTAEELQQVKQPALGGERHGVKSSRQTKKRKRSSTPPEEISFDKETIFRDAESKIEKQTAIEDTNFRGRIQGMDIPDRRRRRSKRNRYQVGDEN
ncbi:MAG: hypothetical protein M1818_006247 [Claussenomyces sp. TS43310]|nr:MAG: hypothetical protein M1818_006247 [Claussenomyces sp. TS43310]